MSGVAAVEFIICMLAFGGTFLFAFRPHIEVLLLQWLVIGFCIDMGSKGLGGRRFQTNLYSR